MSDSSFTAMGEKCGIASPPDTSVSSTSCVDSHLAPHPTGGQTALTEDLTMLDLCMPSLGKQPCDTEEGEVTSSSEIVSAFWNNFNSPLDSVYNEPEKNPFGIITDEDIHCIQTALSTEEGMQILRQTMMTDLSAGYGLSEQDLLTDRLVESLSESTGSAVPQTASPPLAYPISSFEFVRGELPEGEMRMTGELLSNGIPQMYPSLPSDELFSDVLEVLSGSQFDRRPLFDDDDEEIDRPIAIDAAHIDDLVLPDLPPVEEEGRRGEAIDLEADDELVLDDNLLQGFSFIDQSYTSTADNCNSQLDFVFIDDDVKLVDGLETDSSSVDATAERLRESATSKQLRRSTRIQENEQREMAERIRQENIQREQEEALLACSERHLEEHERNKRKDSLSLSSAMNSGDSQMDLFIEHDEEFLFDASEKSNSPWVVAAQRSGKTIPEKRAICQKGKGKGRGKGGKAGKYNRPTSKAVGIWSNTEVDVFDEMTSEEAFLKVEVVEAGVRDEGSTTPPSDEKSDQHDESVAAQISTEESDCPKDQALSVILHDEKLKALTEVRLGRLELEAVLSKPSTHNALGAELEQDAEPTEECVYSKPQLARRQKRKRAESCSALEPALDLTTVVTNEEMLRLDGCNAGCSSEGLSLTVVEDSAALMSLPLERCGVFPRGEKRRESYEEDETSEAKTKKSKNEYEDHRKTEQLKDEVELTGDLLKEPSPGFGSEETASADSLQNCIKKDLKKTVLQKTFSQEGRTDNKIRLMKHRSGKELNNFRNNLDKPKDKDCRPSQIEPCAHDNRMKEKLSEDENKSRLQKKVFGKRKADFKDEGIRNQAVAPYKKLIREEKEKGSAQKEGISQEGKGDKKAIRKSSRCRGCQSAVQPLSLYCNKSCLLKYAELVVQQLKEKKQKLLSMLSSGRIKSPDKFVLIERSSGKLVKISLDLCETKLLNWLLKHPTYEVLKPNTQDHCRTKEVSDLNLKLKRPVATCAQDRGSKSSDKTGKTQDRVSPSSHDRLLPSGLLTKVASSHEVWKKVGYQRTTNSVSSAQRKSSSSSKSEEKSDKPNTSQKIPPPLKDGHTPDCSVKRLQLQEPDAAISQTTLHQKNSTSSSSLKSNPSVKTNSRTGNTDKIVSRSECKSGINKSNNSAISRTNSSSSSNRGSDNNKGSSSNRCNSTDDKSAGSSAGRNNSTGNKHGSSSNYKKDGIDSKNSNGSSNKSSSSCRKGSGASNKSGHGSATTRQSVMVLEEQEQQSSAEILDVARIDIRTELCCILTSRVNRANDVLMSTAEIKRLTLNIEDELWKTCCGIVSNYKRKYRLVLAYLTDPKNHGLFRQVLCGRVTPSQLLNMMSQTDKLSNRPSSRKGSRNHVGSQLQSLAKTGSLLMAMSDTTSMHGQHVFDVSCRLCIGKSSDLRAKESSDLRAKEFSDLRAKESSGLHAGVSSNMRAKVTSDLHANESSDMRAKVSSDLPAKVASDLRAKVSSDLPAKVASDLRAKVSSDLRAKENSSPLPRDGSGDSRDISAVNETKPVTEVDITQDISAKEEAQEIDADGAELPPKVFTRDESLLNSEGVPPWLTTSPVIIPRNSPGPGSDLTDPRDRSRVIPRTKSLVRIKRYSSLLSDMKASTEFSLKSDISHDIEGRPEDLPSLSSSSLSSGSPVWKGNIFAQDVALVAVDAFHLAGSMKFVKSLLPESLTVMGRLEPEVVYDYLTKLKTCYSATKEIAVVGFRASNDPNSSLYSLLYSYLHQRHRCGVIGSIGTAIKDMYIVPLPAKSPIPDILLPDIGPVLERGRDLLLGVIVQQTGRAARASRAVTSKDPLAEHSHSASHVPTEVKSESISVVDSDEKGFCLNDTSSETGNVRASESSDSDSLDVDGSDAIISGYSKIVPLKPTEQKTDLVDVVDGKCEKVPAVDDGDKPYDPFDEEEEEEEEEAQTKIKPTLASSSSSVLPTSATPVSSNNSCILNEGLANLTAVLSTMTNFPVPATILATLVTQATPPNLEGLAKLAIILSGQMSALKQEHIPNSESGVVSSLKPEHAIEVDDGDNSIAKPSNEFEVDRICDDRFKQSDTAENDSKVNGEKHNPTGGKSESVGGKIRNDVSNAHGSCHDVDKTGSPPFKPNDQTRESVGTADDGRAAKKTSLSKLLVANAEFSHLEEDDNEDHLIIDLDSPISEDTFDAKPVGRSHSWHMGLTTVELANGGGDRAEKVTVRPEMTNGIESFDDSEHAEENFGSESRLSVSGSGNSMHLTENANSLRSVEETTESPLLSPSDQDGCLEEQGGIFDSVQDEDVFNCKSFVAMQEAYVYENEIEDNGRDAVRQELMGSSLLSASDTLAKSKALPEAFTDIHSVVEDSLIVDYAKAPWSDELSRSNGDASLDDGSASSLHGARVGPAEEMGSGTTSSQMRSTKIVEVLNDEAVQTESRASEMLAFNGKQILEEEKEAVVVHEVAPLPAPPRPPDRLLQSLKPCPLPEPLLRPPSPKTLLANPFGFHSIFNPTNKPVACVQPTKEAFQERSGKVHSDEMAGWDPYGSGVERGFPQTKPDGGGGGPFDSLPGQSVRLGGPRVRALLQSSVCQKLMEKNCQNVVRSYDASSPSFLESSSLQRPSYHDDPVCANAWLDGRTPSRTSPPLSRSWKSTGASGACRPVLRGSDTYEETDDPVQPGLKGRDLVMSSFGKKIVEPTSTGQNYLSADEEQFGAAYGMSRHRTSGRGLVRRGSAKDGRSTPSLESCNRERGMAPERYDLGKGSERRRRNSRCELERIDQKTRLGGRCNNSEREASAATTEYTRSWSNERRSLLSDSLLCPPGFSEDLSASSSSRGSLLHFRDEILKPIHFPAVRSRQSKDEFEKGRLRSSLKAKCAGRSSDESFGQPGRSGSRLLNAEMSWSEIVSRKEAMSGRDAVRARRTNVAEESLRFHDLDDRFRHDVDHPVSDQQEEGSIWMERPGWEDWRGNDASTGENSDWSMHRKKVESVRRTRASDYGSKSEVKCWEMAEEEQEEGEYVDEQGGDSSEAFGLNQAADSLNYFPLIKDESSRRSCIGYCISPKLGITDDLGEKDSPSCGIVNSGQFETKLGELRVEIDPSDTRKMEDDELEDGEITDPSPPLTHSIPALMSSCSSDLWAKEEFPASRRSETAPTERSGISSHRLERTIQPYVPHSSVAKKPKLLEEPLKQFRKQPAVDREDRSGVYSSLLRPSYDRYIPHHQRGSTSRLPNRQDSPQRQSGFSSGSGLWNGSSSGRGPRDRASNFYPPA